MPRIRYAPADLTAGAAASGRRRHLAQRRQQLVADQPHAAERVATGMPLQWVLKIR